MCEYHKLKKLKNKSTCEGNDLLGSAIYFKICFQ